jgi:hypothetical protein
MRNSSKKETNSQFRFSYALCTTAILLKSSSSCPYTSLLIRIHLLSIKHLRNLLPLNTPLPLRRPKPTIPTRIRIPRPRTPRNRFPALRRPRIDRRDINLGFRINPNIDSRIQAICDSFADEADLHDGVVAALLSCVEECVYGVLGLGLFVGVVRGGFFDFAEELLLNVELAGVRDCAALDGVVGEEFGAVVDDGFM